MDKNELPGKITSEGLLDNKDRKFKLNGIPDIVIKLKEGGYGIYDFKTTNIKFDKSENYRYQLEAYAQIFANPGSTKTAATPKLTPINHMGIIQFEPSEIISHTKNDHNMKFKVSFSPLIRNEKDFYVYITKLIDLLEQETAPPFSENCSLCYYTKSTIKL